MRCPKGGSLMFCTDGFLMILAWTGFRQIILLFSFSIVITKWYLTCFQVTRAWISVSFPRFYLGYLRGRSYPPKMPRFPPKNNVIITVYFLPKNNVIIKSKYMVKIIQMGQGQCTHCNISQNCVSKCTRLQCMFISWNVGGGGACTQTPLGRAFLSLLKMGGKAAS